MIACRSLIRVDLALRLTNSNNSLRQLQKRSFHRVVNPKFHIEVGEFLGRRMDGKKQNNVWCAWKKVSTQSGSSQGEIPQPDLMIVSENLQVFADDKKNEAGNQGKQVHEKHAASMEGASSTVKHSSSKQAVKSPSLDYTHFISLPLAIHPQLVDKLIKFQKSILGTSEMDQELGIERSIFINPKTFHLTVLMLKLGNKDLVKAASEVLQSVSLKVFHYLDAQPVSIRLKGLECMRGSFSKARVLYAPVEEIGGKDRILGACQVIIDAFVEAGLVLEKDAKHKLKLHATVMNARYRKSKAKTTTNDFFDARGIVDQYGSEDWGVYLIREAHLSQRFVYDQNGYYHCCASIPFP